MFENRALEILIVALVVLLLFGAKRLPDAARSLGKSLRILKAETQALRADADGSTSEPASAPEPPTLTASPDPATPSESHPAEDPAVTGTAAPH
jgi:sec-independent protein translocase protein TatA